MKVSDSMRQTVSQCHITSQKMTKPPVLSGIKKPVIIPVGPLPLRILLTWSSNQVLA